MSRAMLLLLLLPLVARAEQVTRNCSAKWRPLTTQRNLLRTEFTHEFTYRVGLQKSAPIPSWETLQGIAVRVSTGRQNVDVQLSHSELSSGTSKTGGVTVPALRSVTVWQLIAETQGNEFGFGNTEVTTSHLEPPSEVVSCSATYNVRELIRSDSRVRLRHQWGEYMVLTMRKGWNAATLGSYNGYYFKIANIGSSTTRITTESPSFSGYYYLYSSTFGGIYFDESDSSNEKQWWYLSNPNPRDGDSVTIGSVAWPGAYITYYSGSTTNVFCEYTSSPNTWTIELV